MNYKASYIVNFGCMRQKRSSCTKYVLNTLIYSNWEHNLNQNSHLKYEKKNKLEKLIFVSMVSSVNDCNFVSKQMI